MAKSARRKRATRRLVIESLEPRQLLSHADGLVGHWQFDGGTGTVVADVSGHGNHGQLTWGPVSTTGRIDGALRFDGNDDHVLVSDVDSLDLSSAITLAAWLRPATKLNQAVIKKARTGSTDGYELSLDAAGKVLAAFNQSTSGTAFQLTSTSSYSTDGCSWIHAAATYDGSSIRLFVNGAEESSLATSFTIATNANGLSIGKQDNGPEAFRGLIDDVRIYDRALSAAEIQVLAGLGSRSDSVDAGPDQTVRRSASTTATLNGTICAAGLPSPPAAVSTTWSQVSGPAAVTFADSSAVDTQASFIESGVYVLRLTAEFGTSSISDDISIAVREEHQTFPIATDTSEKPQSKLWLHDSQWWAVLPANSSDGVVPSTGAWLWRLDGDTWTPVLKLSSSKDVRADVKAVGGVTHILLEDGPSFTELVSVEYVPGSPGTYQFWSARPASAKISLISGVETATIDMDFAGCMWLASDTPTDVVVRYSAFPYSLWSTPVTVATGISGDDLSVVTALPAGTRLPDGTELVDGGIAVLWSNQVTRRLGFRVHTTDTAPCSNPMVWSADEVPDSQTAAAYQDVGGGVADDHLNVAVASDGTLYVAVKTSFDTSGEPLIGLLVRRPSGTWDPLYSVDIRGNRPIVLLNESEGSLMVVYTGSGTPTDIVYRRSAVSPIAIGPRQTLISGLFHNVTSTKQNVTDELVALASNCSSDTCPTPIIAGSSRLKFAVGNHAPVVQPIAPVAVDEASTLEFTATAVDSDVAANSLVFSLDAGAPAGASMDPVTGIFTWSPTEAQGPGTYRVRVHATDNGSPPLDGFETVTISVNERNRPPVLANIGTHSVVQGGVLSFTVLATDPDLPANSLVFSLNPSAPAGARIDPTTGVFTWTPDAAGVYEFNVSVSDNGSPIGHDSTGFAVSVLDRTAPTVTGVALAPGLKKTIAGIVLTFSEPLDPSRAGLAMNYKLELSGKDKKFSRGFGVGDDTLIPVGFVRIEPDHRSVYLKPNPLKPLKLTQAIELVVRGTGAAGVTDVAGNALEGGEFTALVGTAFSYLDGDGDTASLALANSAGGVMQLVRRADGEHLRLPGSVTLASVLSGKIKVAKLVSSDGRTTLQSITPTTGYVNKLPPSFQVLHQSNSAAVDALLDSRRFSAELRLDGLLDSV